MVLSGLHFLTHVGQSWVLAALGSRLRRDRWLVALAGILPDLDGIGILWSQEAYVAAHRVAGHNFLFGALLVAIALARAGAVRITGALVAASFHLHLLLDLVGTGGPPIRYLWPLDDRGFTCSGWVLASWQNGLVMILTLLAVLLVARPRTRPKR